MIIGSEQAQATDSLITGRFDVVLNRTCPNFDAVEMS